MILAQKQISLNRKQNILPAKFTNNTVSKHVSLSYLQNFKDKIGFSQLLENGLTYQKHHNCLFTTAETIDFMVDATILGYTRFNHMDQLRFDNAHRILRGGAPSEKVCRDLLLIMPESAKTELRWINRQLLARKAKTEGCRNVILNVDDTVCTVYGSQEGSGVGYNPSKRGRASYKEKVGILGTTNEIINLTLENGKHHCNFELEAFIRKCRVLLPDEWTLQRVRIDSGAYDIDNLDYLDDSGLEFVIKCKKYAHIKLIIDVINQKEHLYAWQKIDDMFSAVDIHYKSSDWSKPYRFVAVRKPAKVKNDKQITLDIDEIKYDYQVIVTNIDYLSVAEIFHEYNQRCDIENRIDELKEGFAFDQNSRKNQKCNELFLLIKMIAYNLHNWFKQAILPQSWLQHEIVTIRRCFYHLAANICGKGRYRYINYSENRFVKDLISKVISRLRCFSLNPA
jgi:hypothetical protein